MVVKFPGRLFRIYLSETVLESTSTGLRATVATNECKGKERVSEVLKITVFFLQLDEKR